MRNQDNPQGRHFGSSSETNRDRFLDAHSGPARADREPVLRLCKGQTGFEGHGTFCLPEAAQRAELLRPSQKAALPSLAHSWTGLLSNWNVNKETKDNKKKQGKHPNLLLVPQQLITPSHKT